MKHLLCIFSFTHASFNVDIITPTSITLTVNNFFIQTITRVSPAISRTVVSDSCSVRPRVNTIFSCPVGPTKIILTYSKRSFSTIYGCKEKQILLEVKVLMDILITNAGRHVASTILWPWSPNSISSALNFKRFLLFRDRILLLRVVTIWTFNYISNRASVCNTTLILVPINRICLLQFFIVCCACLGVFFKRGDFIFWAKDR